jgi:signal transduction histidine kinase/streptogramin lyase
VEDRAGRILSADEERIAELDPVSAALRYLPALPGGAAIKGLLVGRDGVLWIGGVAGGLVARYPDGRTRTWSHNSADAASIGAGAILPLLEDGDGSLWIGVEGEGLDRLDPARRYFEHYRPGSVSGSAAGGDAAPGRALRSLARDSTGRLWAGSADAGLSRFNAGSGRFEPVNAGSPRAGGSVACLLADRGGGLWIGTLGAGLWRLDGEGGALEPFRGPEGLLGDSVYGIVQAADGVLWMRSSRGLVSLDARVGGFFLFGAEDGLPPGDLSTGALLAGRDGLLWVATGGGLRSFDPHMMPRYAPQPDVVATGVESAGGGKVSRSADGSELILGHDNGGLAFRIAVIDYVAPSRNRYAFRLEGLQAGWSSLEGDNAGYLAALPPGRYTLRIRGANGNGVWNQYGASLAVTVRPPVWGTWWFRTAAVLAALALVALGIALRVRNLRRRNRLLVKFARHIEEAREEERTMAARDVHDEIGQDLMVLNIHAYWLLSHGESPAQERLSKVREMQGSILAAMASVKAVATKLRPEALDVLEFPDAIRWYLRSLERVGGIELEADIGGPVAGLGKELATALFRVLQEMLSNVMRHAKAGKVSVRFGVEDGAILLEVRDDGAGMDAGSVDAPDSFGMIGMRERLATHGGSLVVESASGQGTLVRARVPLPGSGARARRPRGWRSALAALVRLGRRG